MIYLNGVQYIGGPNNPNVPWAPDAEGGITRSEGRVGRTLIAASGRRRFISRNRTIKTWTLTWTLTPAVTRNALRTLLNVNGSFTFIDEDGSSHSVQCESDALQESIAAQLPDGTRRYDLTLTIYQAN